MAPGAMALAGSPDGSGAPETVQWTAVQKTVSMGNARETSDP